MGGNSSKVYRLDVQVMKVAEEGEYRVKTFHQVLVNLQVDTRVETIILEILIMVQFECRGEIWEMDQKAAK